MSNTERGEGVRRVASYPGKSILDGWNRQCQGPEAGWYGCAWGRQGGRGRSEWDLKDLADEVAISRVQ